MKKDPQLRRALIALTLGAILSAIGFIMNMSALFSVYGAADKSFGNCSSAECSLDKSEATVHIAQAVMSIGFILLIIGLVLLILKALQKNKKS